MQIPSGTRFSARALLFDMDGTLIDSTAVVERVWMNWANKHRLPKSAFRHGQRAIDTIRELAPPGVDVLRELAEIDAAELADTDGITAIAGAATLIARIPPGRWALVTSAVPRLARVRMAAGGLPMPKVAVTAADVERGKPHPDGYLQALDRLGVSAQEAIVFEDAPAGLAAGRAAGCRCIALSTTTPVAELGEVDYLPDLSAILIDSVDDEGVHFSIR